MKALLLAALLTGCGAPAKQTRHRAELVMGGSLVGVMAGGLTMAAWPDGKPALIPITIGFGALAVASLVVYIVADQSASD
jgi:hypothetical protein